MTGGKSFLSNGNSNGTISTMNQFWFKSWHNSLIKIQYKKLWEINTSGINLDNKRRIPQLMGYSGSIK